MQEPKEPKAPETDEDLSEQELDEVAGGVCKTPSPGGPLPIPYPNVPATE